MKVTLKQIADIAGVSRGTVDRALHDRAGVNPQVRKQILAVARELNYQPNLAGRQLSAKKSGIRFGVILPYDDKTGSWNDVHQGIRAAQLELAGYGVEVVLRNYAHYTAKEQIALIDQLVETGINGLAIVPTNAPLMRQRLQSLADGGLPIIIFNSTVEGFSPLCYVGTDYALNGRTAAGLLHMLSGSRRIELAIMTGASNMFSSTTRIRGLLQELDALGANCHLIDTYKLFSADESSDREYAYELTIRMLRQHPELNAVFTVAGSVQTVARAIADEGLSGRIIHLAFDLNRDTIPSLQNGSITAVIGQESFRQGYQPLKLLFDHVVNGIQLPASIILKSELFIKQNAMLDRTLYSPLSTVTPAPADESSEEKKVSLT